MRSKKSSSDLTILRKDLTRFAPVGLGLSAWLAIWTTTMIDSSTTYEGFYEPIAPFFAPLLAIVVFGYLCDPVECNMVHSLPIRRTRLFAIHTAAASILFLVPVAVFCFVTRFDAQQTAMYRFLFTALEFIFLFSIGVLCVMITGRKIGAALLYFFIQALSGIVSIIIEFLYLPELPGVYLGYGFLFDSPTLLVSSYANFMETTKMDWRDWSFIAFVLADTLVIMGISLVLYRRRKLEHAGDLLAVRRLDPFFAFCSGMTGISAMYLFSYNEPELPVYLLGAAIGYLAYWMLSKKTARIFNPRIIGGLACLLAAIAGSVYLVSLDPLDRVHYVPDPEQVKEMTMTDDTYASEDYKTSDPAVIVELEKLHLALADHYIAIGGTDLPSYQYSDVKFTYKLKNGRTIQRLYQCKDDALLEQAAWYLSQPSALFGKDDPNFNMAQVRYDMKYVRFHPDLTEELIDLVLSECREGEMYTFGDESEWRIELQHANKGGVFYVDVPESAADVIAWLEANCTKYE